MPRLNPKNLKKDEVSRKQAVKILWNKGVLKWKLDDLQKQIYDQFYDDEDDITTMLIARQTGKSFLLAVLAVEVCLRKSDSVVKYVTPKLKMVKNILNKNMKVILKDCPPELMPEWKEGEKVWRFPNGSEIQAAGSDNQNYDNIRGGTCDLWIVDEAGFCDDLDEVIYSVLIPTTTMTDGTGILSSTPDPKNPEHDFIKNFVEPAELESRLFKYTIHDNVRLSEEEKQKIIKRYPGGVNNPRFRAEYMCEIVRDSENTVIPEFDASAEKEIVLEDYERPKFFDVYLSMDIGGKDFTVILFAFYDFLKNRVVIEDEYVLRKKQNSEEIATNVRKKLEALYDEKPPYLMFADNNNIILLNDLQLKHNLNFIPTKKDNKEAAINNVRLKILNRELVIHPRCKTLIYHLKHANWARRSETAIRQSNYKAFARSADGGHFDALDALIYLIRNVVYGKNPYPSHYGALSPANAYTRTDPKDQYDAISKLFKVRKSIKS